MEEEVNQRVISLSFSTGRMTAGVIARAMSRFLANEHQALNRIAEERHNAKEHELPHGRMTIEELMSQNAGAERVEIDNEGIRSFNRIARKYGIDYSIFRDNTEQPPKYNLFFKPRDKDVMNLAFKEYIEKVRETQGKKTMKQKIKEYGEKSKQREKGRSKERHKSRERSK